MRTADNPHDYYPTPPSVTKALVAKGHFKGLIWEPAASEGAIVQVLKEAGYEVLATDISSGTDFLISRRSVPNIVTNPPFSDNRAEEFCRKALKIATSKVAMLIPMWFLEGIQRYDLFAEQPLKTIYVCSRRPRFGEKKYNSPFGMCWAVWDKQYKGKPHIEWRLD